MEHLYRESRYGPPPAPHAGRPIPADAPVAPGARSRWQQIPVAPAPCVGTHRSPTPIVATISHGARARSWAIDPGLVAILALAAGAIAVGLLGALLSALLMWTL